MKDSWGTVTLVDSRIVGRDAGPNTPGILNQRGLYLRNVMVSGLDLSEPLNARAMPLSAD